MAEEKETETSKEVIEDVEKTGVPEAIAKKEEKLDEKATKEAKSEKKDEKRVEKEFIIPLRKTFRNAVRYKRAPKAIRTVREFLLRHMKVYDGNLESIKIDKYLNEFIWARSIKNPPAKVKIKAYKDGEFVIAELAELPDKLGFRKQKIEKREKKEEAEKGKKKSEKEEKAPETPEKTEEQIKEEKEKKAAVVEAGKQMEKATAKQAKHQTKQPKQQKAQPRRMALQK